MSSLSTPFEKKWYQTHSFSWGGCIIGDLGKKKKDFIATITQ
jgi:hypothetical protein